MKYLLFILSLSFSSLLLSQEEPAIKFKKHSIGFDYQLYGEAPKLGITYRKFKKASKYNFVASLFIGGNNKLTYSGGQHTLIYRTTDSAVPYIIVSNPKFRSSSYQRVELGIERVIGFNKFDAILGVKMNVGHEHYSQISTIDRAGEAYYPKNSIPYYRLIAVGSELYGSINSLTGTTDYLTTGLGLQGGAKFDLFTNFYFSVLVNVRLDALFTVSEKYELRNGLYEEHFSDNIDYAIFNFNTGLRMGLHYKF